jgi:hypothetical protein
VKKWREAIGFCKEQVGIKGVTDLTLSAEDRMGFEKCIVNDFLLKKGMNYFGNRDVFYIDMYGMKDVLDLAS